MCFKLPSKSPRISTPSLTAQGSVNNSGFALGRTLRSYKDNVNQILFVRTLQKAFAQLFIARERTTQIVGVDSFVKLLQGIGVHE